MGTFKEKAIECFIKYDKDKSTFIEIIELKNLMTDVAKEVGMATPEECEIQDVLKDFDLNNDKKLSKEEFLNLFEVIYEMKVNK